MKKLSFLITSLAMMISHSLLSQGVGIGTTIPKAAFNVAEGKTILFGADTTGMGTKLMWLPAKRAFRAGTFGPVAGTDYLASDGSTWAYDSIGMNSIAIGIQNKATSTGSIAFGGRNKSRGLYTISMGYDNYTKWNYALAFGKGNQSIGLGSIALGENNQSLLGGSIAIGEENHSEHLHSIAIGLNNTVRQAYGFSAGLNNYNTASGGVSMGLSHVVNSYGCFVAGANSDTIPGAGPTTWHMEDPIFIIGNGPTSLARKNAMVVLKNGKTGFGTHTPVGQIHSKFNSAQGVPNIYLEETGNDYSRITFKNANPGFWDAGAYAQQLFGDNVDAKFNIYYSLFGGNVFTLRGNGDASLAGTLTQYSDERLKDHVQTLEHVLPKLMKISGYTYHWKEEARSTQEQIGLLAGEIEAQFPQLVQTDEEGLKSVAYSNFTAVLLQAIKEQQQQIDILKQQILELQ